MADEIKELTEEDFKAFEESYLKRPRWKWITESTVYRTLKALTDEPQTCGEIAAKAGISHGAAKRALQIIVLCQSFPKVLVAAKTQTFLQGGKPTKREYVVALFESKKLKKYKQLIRQTGTI